MSSSNVQDNPWSKFDDVRHRVKSYTVDRLKHIIAGLNEECRSTISKQGKKQELIDKITRELDMYRYKQLTDNWIRAQNIMDQVRATGSYTSSGSANTFTASQAFAQNNTSGSSFTPKSVANGHYAAGGAAGSSIGRYDPYAPPRQLPPQTSASPARAVGVHIPIRFKPSPFFKVDQAISSVVECPESNGAMDRRSQSLQFSLNQDQLSKLTQPSSKYQVRLYCTTNAFYNPSPTGFRTQSQPCLIEFPATCEVRVNGSLLQANLKGIKKKPGTAPPADLSKEVKTSAGAPNKIEMVYVNSQTNTGAKKFYLIVFLVEVSSVGELVDRLRKGKFRTFEEIKTQMNASQIDDDDIVAGKQKMTLKCPLSYTRIKIPCRSDKCVHPQCFDAVSWYSVMEQTTTWLCPVCDKMLEPNDLIVDGYFDNILKSTPDHVEEVEVEPNGEWHTADDKYGTPSWVSARRSELVLKGKGSSTRSTLPSPKKVQAESASANHSLGSVVILDSDSENEDESRVKKELSPSNGSLSKSSYSRDGYSASASAPASASARKTPAVIDLTLDSDSEGEQSQGAVSPRIPLAQLKRKASDISDVHEDGTYKRPRPIDLPQKLVSIPLPRRESGSYANGSSTPSTSTPASASTSTFSRTLPPPIPTTIHRSTDLSNRILPPPTSVSPLTPYDSLPPYPHQGHRQYAADPYAAYAQRPPSNASPPFGSPETRRLPPPHAYNSYLSRPNGTSGGAVWP